MHSSKHFFIRSGTARHIGYQSYSKFSLSWRQQQEPTYLFPLCGKKLGDLLVFDLVAPIYFEQLLLQYFLNEISCEKTWWKFKVRITRNAWEIYNFCFATGKYCSKLQNKIKLKIEFFIFYLEVIILNFSLNQPTEIREWFDWRDL